MYKYRWTVTPSPSTTWHTRINPLNPELNPICYLPALLGAHHFLHVSRIRVNTKPTQDFIDQLTVELFATCSSHPNPLVQQIAKLHVRQTEFCV